MSYLEESHITHTYISTSEVLLEIIALYITLSPVVKQDAATHMMVWRSGRMSKLEVDCGRKLHPLLWEE